MWAISVKKYSGILSTLVGFNNIVNIDCDAEGVATFRVSTPSHVGYAELQVPEFKEPMNKLFDFKPLVGMFNSKVANEVMFSPSVQMAMFNKPYIYRERVPEIDEQDEWSGINEGKGLPEKILNSCAGKLEGTYVAEDNSQIPVAVLSMDNQTLVDMARRVGAPRTILTIDFAPDALTLSGAEGKSTKLPKDSQMGKEIDFPKVGVKIMLSMETQPMVFGSLLGAKAYIYIVHDRYILVDAAGGQYRFLCASYAGGVGEELSGIEV